MTKEANTDVKLHVVVNTRDCLKNSKCVRCFVDKSAVLN